MHICRMIGAIAAVSSLAACLGGGGGDGSRQFVSFSALEPGRTSELDGRARVVEYETAVGGEVSAGDAEVSDATVSLTLDDVGALLAASISVDRGNVFGGTPIGVAFDTDDGDVFADGDVVDPITSDYGVAVTAAEDQIAIVADPVAMGFEYQSFGIWATGIDEGSGVAGVITAGAATPVAEIPDAGLALYSGNSAGFFIDPDGDAFLAFADFGATLDFSDLSLTVLALDTEVIDVSSGVSSPMSDLNFAGAGFVSGDGTFSINIAATDLAGDLDGRLYGPAGAELGGTFEMEGDAGRYMGAVGAAQ
jgi:hypothetical protein